MRRNKLVIDKVSEMLAPSLGRWPTVAELAQACELSEREILEAVEFGRVGDPRSLDESLDNEEADGSAPLSEYVGCEDGEFDLSLDRLTLATALDTLPAREKTILQVRFYRQLSQRQIAERIEISQMHVSRLERAALQKLRVALQRSSIALNDPGREPRSSPFALPATS